MKLLTAQSLVGNSVIGRGRVSRHSQERQDQLSSSGFTGTYGGPLLILDASVHALWEHEDAITDNLGTLQATHERRTGFPSRHRGGALSNRRSLGYQASC
jgi:hypothetical protein